MFTTFTMFSMFTNMKKKTGKKWSSLPCLPRLPCFPCLQTWRKKLAKNDQVYHVYHVYHVYQQFVGWKKMTYSTQHVYHVYHNYHVYQQIVGRQKRKHEEKAPNTMFTTFTTFTAFTMFTKISKNLYSAPYRASYAPRSHAQVDPTKCKKQVTPFDITAKPSQGSKNRCRSLWGSLVSKTQLRNLDAAPPRLMEIKTTHSHVRGRFLVVSSWSA